MDATIGQTPFDWLRSAPDGRGASNLIGLPSELPSYEHSGPIPAYRHALLRAADQVIREGNATPAWLANDFNANCRQSHHKLSIAPRHISKVAHNPANCHRCDSNRRTKQSGELDSAREIPKLSERYEIHEAKHGTLKQVKQQCALTKLHRDKASYAS